jgi:hypothetical protein
VCVWSTDITYIKIAGGMDYMAAIIDWHSKGVLSHRFYSFVCANKHLENEFVFHCCMLNDIFILTTISNIKSFLPVEAEISVTKVFITQT